eukprot:gene5894-biopygen13231
METIVNKEPPDKRTRPDRAAKIKDRKNGEEYVVKCTLSRIIADKDNKDVIIKVIKERVDSVSKRTYLAGVAVNRILKEVFEGVPDAQLHTVSVPSVDQNFIRQLMVGSRQAHMETRDATVERFFHNNYWFREKVEGRERALEVDLTHDDEDEGAAGAKWIKLGDKWTLSGVGDKHGNDDWLRLFNKDGTGYYGGLAAGRLWSGGATHLNGPTSTRDINANGNVNVTGKLNANTDT